MAVGFAREELDVLGIYYDTGGPCPFSPLGIIVIIICSFHDLG